MGKRAIVLAFMGLAMLVCLVGCPSSTDTSSSGGLFGDRPLPDDGEGDTGPRKDASTDAKDATSDRGVDTGEPVDAGDDTM